MAYAIGYLKEISVDQRERLVTGGIRTTGELLYACTTDDGLNRLGQATGIEAALLLRWARRADLMRISGVGPQFAELIESCDVHSVAALCLQDPEQFTLELIRKNDQIRVSRTSPGLSLVRDWIDQASFARPLTLGRAEESDH